jgi:hypothetical protein
LHGQAFKKKKTSVNKIRLQMLPGESYPKCAGRSRPGQCAQQRACRRRRIGYLGPENNIIQFPIYKNNTGQPLKFTCFYNRSILLHEFARDFRAINIALIATDNDNGARVLPPRQFNCSRSPKQRARNGRQYHGNWVRYPTDVALAH